jgi:hypothetical protein
MKVYKYGMSLMSDGWTELNDGIPIVIGKRYDYYNRIQDIYT